MKNFLTSHKVSITTLSIAILGAIVSLTNISPVTAATFQLEGIFNDNQQFSGNFSIENQTLTNYEINVGSATIPTQAGPGTTNAFTYSPTACQGFPSLLCQSIGNIAPTSLQVSFGAASGGDGTNRNFTFNVLTGFPLNGGTVNGNAFESFQCTRCGGNVPSSFERAGIGTVTAVTAVTAVPEPKMNWGVLTTGLLGVVAMYKMRGDFRVKGGLT